MSKAAMFPIAKPYPEWTSGRPMDFCGTIPNPRKVNKTFYTVVFLRTSVESSVPRTCMIPGSAATFPICFMAGRKPPIPGGEDRGDQISGDGQMEKVLTR